MMTDERLELIGSAQRACEKRVKSMSKRLINEQGTYINVYWRMPQWFHRELLFYHYHYQAIFIYKSMHNV